MRITINLQSSVSFGCRPLKRYCEILNDSLWFKNPLRNDSGIILGDSQNTLGDSQWLANHSGIILGDLKTTLKLFCHKCFSKDSQIIHSWAILELDRRWSGNDEDYVSVCSRWWNWFIRSQKSLATRIKWSLFVMHILEMSLNDQDNNCVCSTEGDGTRW